MRDPWGLVQPTGRMQSVTSALRPQHWSRVPPSISTSPTRPSPKRGAGAYNKGPAQPDAKEGGPSSEALHGARLCGPSSSPCDWGGGAGGGGPPTSSTAADGKVGTTGARKANMDAVLRIIAPGVMGVSGSAHGHRRRHPLVLQAQCPGGSVQAPLRVESDEVMWTERANSKWGDADPSYHTYGTAGRAAAQRLAAGLAIGARRRRSESSILDEGPKRFRSKRLRSATPIRRRRRGVSQRGVWGLWDGPETGRSEGCRRRKSSWR